MKIKVRFNRSRGQEGRGTVDHVWRVFAGSKEYIVKNIVFTVPCYGEREGDSEDWNMVAEGNLHIDRENSTIVVVE
jgi:hypothetical protein